jgi:hypothetical protein
MRAWLTRLSKWWGYVRVDGKMVTFTQPGQKAMEIWQRLDGVIEERWRSRFGPDAIEALRQALDNILSRQTMELPESLPILGYGFWSRWLEKPLETKVERPPTSSLVALAAAVLYLFAFEFEKESEVSLALSANVLRLLDDGEVAVRDLPGLAGMSKEAAAVAVSFLTKSGYAVAEAKSGAGRGKLLTLTPKGMRTSQKCTRLVEGIEARWEERFGKQAISALRVALEPFEEAALLRNLKPYPGSWRAALPPPATLPQFPLVLHRGGYPDGS